MITKDEAQQLVFEKINESKMNRSDNLEYVILPNSTLTRSYGWVFFYESKRYLETKKFSERLTGNAPIIVNKHTGELIQTGTAYPFERYLDEYESRNK